MKAVIEYDEFEVSKMVVEHHTKTFGNAPEGYRWESEFFYEGCRVKNVKVSDEKE